MSDQIAINDDQCGHMIAQLAGIDYHSRAITPNLARVVDDEFVGGVIYSNYTGESIGISVGAVTPKWMNRDVLFIAFDYPFRLLGCNRIFSQISEDNDHTLEFNAKLGFKRVARIEGVYPGGRACIVTCLEKTDCRFLSIKPRTIAIVPNTLN